ncbi:restriction endonuclease [Streptomyces sp. BH104]|uniref:restriction endonuclease n=1 Tax=Streptomyces sp. BH104 TaxID=3410407 RepID=UPI003BB68AA7
MATYQSASRRRVRKTRPIARRRRKINAWWLLAAAGAVYGAFNTWPMYTGLAVAVILLAIIVVGVRPRRLDRLTARIGQVASRVRIVMPQRSVIPAQRTVESFHRLTPGRFEEAVAELASLDRDTVQATVVGGSGDGGMDVRVKRADGTDVLVQCKRYRKGGNVPARDIRDANGAYRDLHRCHRAVIVTTSDFTRDAKATNAVLPQRIRLVNGADLVAWANGGPSPLN